MNKFAFHFKAAIEMEVDTGRFHLTPTSHPACILKLGSPLENLKPPHRRSQAFATAAGLGLEHNSKMTVLLVDEAQPEGDQATRIETALW